MHIANICKTASTKIKSVNTIRYTFDEKQTKLLYNSFVLPQFNFLKIEEIQKRGLRIVYDNPHMSSQELLNCDHPHMSSQELLNCDQPSRHLPAQRLTYKLTTTRCDICSKLTIKTSEGRQWRRSGVFIVSCEHISYLALVFLLLTLKM